MAKLGSHISVGIFFGFFEVGFFGLLGLPYGLWILPNCLKSPNWRFFAKKSPKNRQIGAFSPNVSKLVLFHPKSPGFDRKLPNWIFLVKNRQIGEFLDFFEENQDFWEIWPFLTWFLAFWNQVNSIGHYNFKNPIIQIILKIDFWHFGYFLTINDIVIIPRHLRFYTSFQEYTVLLLVLGQIIVSLISKPWYVNTFWKLHRKNRKP